MDDHPQVKAVRAFNAAHGEFVASGHQIYYRDGSFRENVAYGVLWDATSSDKLRPDIEWQVGSNIVTFFRLKLEEAVTQFDELNTRLAFSVPTDPDVEIAKLQRLQLCVEERKRELAKAEAALENTQWGRARKDVRDSEQERRQRSADFQARRRAIRI